MGVRSACDPRLMRESPQPSETDDLKASQQPHRKRRWACANLRPDQRFRIEEIRDDLIARNAEAEAMSWSESEWSPNPTPTAVQLPALAHVPHQRPKGHVRLREDSGKRTSTSSACAGRGGRGNGAEWFFSEVTVFRGVRERAGLLRGFPRRWH